jgi:hypothetical protein
VFTDMIWIPLFIWVHLGLAPLVRAARAEALEPGAT